MQLFAAAVVAAPLGAQGAPLPTAGSSGSESSGLATTLTLYAMMYTGFGTVIDPGSESTWLFADASLGAGASVHAELGPVALGVDGAWTRTRYERRPGRTGAVLASGRASVLTLLATGRLASPDFRIPGIPRIPGAGGRDGFGGLSTYLTIGAGAVAYALDDLEDRNVDFAFAAGAGLEYGWPSGRAAFLELERFWGFHEREGVESARARHDRIELGVRLPLTR